ncbi:MAG: class I SAM-dependent methyltransferase, partial [Solirubrobacteraceae bacterium]
MLHNAGHRQCRFAALDITAQKPIPAAPFDLVYARLLISHLPDRVAGLRRLWDAVAPGGHLLIHDYDMRSLAVLPRSTASTSSSTSSSPGCPPPGATCTTR